MVFKSDELSNVRIVYFKNEPGPFVKTASLVFPPGNRTPDLASLVHRSANCRKLGHEFYIYGGGRWWPS